MISGVVVGIVLDNADPNRLNRVKVRFPVESEDSVESSWCRMITPMAGKDRGLVALPEIGTEVLLGFAFRSLSPYVLGAVYNGKDDKPEPFDNSDRTNDKRVFWSRSGHLVIFDDTEGSEQVALGADAGTSPDVTGAPIHHILDAANASITEYCEKDTEWESVGSFSIKCSELEISANNSITITSGAETVIESATTAKITSGGIQSYTAPSLALNPSGGGASAATAPASPSPKHPPVK